MKQKVGEHRPPEIPSHQGHPDRPFAPGNFASWAAIMSIPNGKLRATKRAIVDALFAHPSGLTNDEIAQVTGIPKVTTQPRVTWLKDAGLVIDTGRTRPGLLPESKDQTVWRLNDGGRFVEPKIPISRPKLLDALERISDLHQAREGQQLQLSIAQLCDACRTPVPCRTAQIVDAVLFPEAFGS